MWVPFRNRPETERDSPDLRSLGPQYEGARHGRHVRVLLDALTQASGNPPKNIALTGHYGSGKSSVIVGLQQRLTADGINWVNLSLSSLGVDDTKRVRVQADGSLAPLTNLIQKEIVKQLLYRKSPSDMPGSRFHRVDSFRWARALGWSTSAGVIFFVTAILFGLVERAKTTGPQPMMTSHAWVPWVTVAALSLFVAAVFFLGIRTLQNRVRLDSLSAGGAAVQLSKPANSYFDEYLDEIVYFFQRTKTQVAIFEDLDRFKDPHIFETLRELNTVLNNSEQIRSRPVRFVYAVRDSIFESLDRSKSAGGDTGAGTSPDAEGANAKDTDTDTVTVTEAPSTAASALEAAPSANRTKFFDLVIPMVPFLTHRSARDLVAAEFKDADAGTKPETALVNLVGAHLTDMRLIRNIRNEFEIYRASVLGSEGLKGLTPNRLFAMMVYKNLHLEDFEDIRHGSSKIDAAHSAFRKMVAYQTTHQAELSKKALDEAASGRLWTRHAETAGEGLGASLQVFRRIINRPVPPVLVHAGTTYDLAGMKSASFWRTFFEDQQSAQLQFPGYGGVFTLTPSDIVALAGETAATMQETVKADIADLRRRSRAALKAKDEISRASMAQLIGRTDLTMPTDNGLQNLNTIVSGLVSPLARDLLAAGHIDENYTLYCSDFHAIAISLDAMNFILHCVQPDTADPQFKFEDSASIDTVEAETGERFLGGESAFNVEVFDHYLATAPEKLTKAVETLAVRVATDTSFVDTYLRDGRHAGKFARLIADQWPGIFRHVSEAVPVDPDARIDLFDATLSAADPAVEYETSSTVQQFIADNYDQMDVLTKRLPSEDADRVAALLSALGAQIKAIGLLGPTQRSAIVHARLYPMTRPNLEAAIGEGHSLSLDNMREESEGVYRHAIENLDEYLRLLADDETTVDDAGQFLKVMNDIAATDTTNLQNVAQRANDSCEIHDLAALAENAWAPIVAAGRFVSTTLNVSRLVKHSGVTADLTKFLISRPLADPAAVSEEDRTELAYALADASDLSASERVRLIRDLDLASHLVASDLTDGGLRIVPALVDADLVPDTAETYAAISGQDFDVREAYIAASSGAADYASELAFDSADLKGIIASRSVGPDVKQAIINDVESLEPRLNRTSAIAICDWADGGRTTTPDLLVALATADAPAERILSLLEPHLHSIAIEDLDRLLVALGDEYEPLTRRGGHRPKLKSREGTEALLVELENRGRVSSHSTTMMGGIRANMRH